MNEEMIKRAAAILEQEFGPDWQCIAQELGIENLRKTKSFLRNFRFLQSQAMRPYRAFSYSSIILRSIVAILKFTSPLLTV